VFEQIVAHAKGTERPATQASVAALRSRCARVGGRAGSGSADSHVVEQEHAQRGKVFGVRRRVELVAREVEREERAERAVAHREGREAVARERQKAKRRKQRAAAGCAGVVRRVEVRQEAVAQVELHEPRGAREPEAAQRHDAVARKAQREQVREVLGRVGRGLGRDQVALEVRAADRRRKRAKRAQRVVAQAQRRAAGRNQWPATHVPFP